MRAGEAIGTLTLARSCQRRVGEGGGSGLMRGGGGGLLRSVTRVRSEGKGGGGGGLQRSIARVCSEDKGSSGGLLRGTARARDREQLVWVLLSPAFPASKVGTLFHVCHCS
jgi:hypothetical protein